MRPASTANLLPESSDCPRILYLRPSVGSLPLNARTADLLADEFPEFEIVTVDVFPLVRRFKSIVLTNAVVTFFHYFSDLVRRKKKFRQCFWRTPYVFRTIRRLIRREYGQLPWAFTFQIQSLFDASMGKTPNFVYTDHTHLANLSYPGFDRSKLFSGQWIACEREIYSKAAAVFMMSSNMRASVIQDYGIGPDHVHCVFSGPNIAIPATREGLDARRQPQRILFVGVDWRRKGGDVLLRAFERVRKDFPSAELEFVGCEVPPDTSVPDGVRFRGRVPLGRIGETFAEAAIFCLPTRLEPFGIVFVEAMAYGLPIIATRLGAIPDLIDDGVNGLLVRPDNAEEVSSALRELLGNPARAMTMGLAGRRRYEEKFNWPHTFGQMRKRIEERVGRESMPPRASEARSDQRVH